MFEKCANGATWPLHYHSVVLLLMFGSPMETLNIKIRCFCHINAKRHDHDKDHSCQLNTRHIS